MTININIKANVSNVTLSQIFELLKIYSLDEKRDGKIFEFNGYKYKIEAKINLSIDYVITEIIK